MHLIHLYSSILTAQLLHVGEGQFRVHSGTGDTRRCLSPRWILKSTDATEREPSSAMRCIIHSLVIRYLFTG